MLNKNVRGFHSWAWSQACHELRRKGESFVLVTLVGAAGSTPRSSGTKMVVSAEHIYDTIGGGHLEFAVIQQARELLAAGESTQVLKQMSLGAELAQCCGGSVSVMYECLVNENLNLDIYGAGHVAHALIKVLGELPIRIRWIDERQDCFPEQIPENVTQVVEAFPVEKISDAPANTAFLVLTHNHQLDYELAKAVIKHRPEAWLGVIGSDTKAKRFQSRLKHMQFSDQQIEQMICPVGLAQVKGKLPMEVAVSIAGQVIELYQKNESKLREGVQWREIKSSLNSNVEKETSNES